MLPNFLVDHKTLYERIAEIDPVVYAGTRNYLQGSVTYLSPFITHGIISTERVANVVLEKYNSGDAEKFLTELAWREYFHRVWQVNGSDIFGDIQRTQEPVCSDQLPVAIAEACTGIETIDECLVALKNTGYMHNHARMWVAALCCNTSRTHWYQPARWLYYHLLDGDLASNTLSWQWVAGTFSHRKYIANQENLNRFSGKEQYGTFLDTSYEVLANCAVPSVLEACTDITLSNEFPQSTVDPLRQSDEPVFLYSIWNLDPQWQRTQKGTRILWIDPDTHREFALSPLRWQFIKHWADAIDGLGIFVGSRDQLFPKGVDHIKLLTREYPATAHWPGERDARDWCYENPTGPIKSFSNFWKHTRKSSSIFNQ